MPTPRSLLTTVRNAADAVESGAREQYRDGRQQNRAGPRRTTGRHVPAPGKGPSIVCGIAGISTAESIAPTDRRRVEQAVVRLRHRGPDAAGFFADTACVLGHARLSIIDLSPAANQPLPNEDNTVQAVVNGEIYNFRELRTALESQGHVFRSESDSEVVVHGWEAWGEAMVERLHGMFALAVWDAAQRRLLLARDRLGQKPLYYSFDPQHRTITFASELPALLTLLDRTPAISPVARDAYFTFGYVPAPYSIYEGIRKLGPGRRLSFVADSATLRETVYWDPVDASRPPSSGPTDPAEVTAQLDTLLDRAIETHLVSDVPLGCFLSGGIDSSLIAAVAARRRPALQTFSVAFDFADYDESPFAEKIAETLRTSHTTVHCGVRDALDIIPQLPDIYGEPFADSSAIPTRLLCREAKKNFTVALSGDAGDELFWGYNRYEHYRRFALMHPALRLFRLTATRVFSNPPFPRALRERANGLRYYRGFAEFALLFGGIFHLIKFEQLRGGAFDLDRTLLPDAARRCRQVGIDPLLWGPRLDLYSYLPGDILAKVDRASMQSALEVRVPLLDAEVVDWALRLPSSALTGGRGDRKRPLRALLEKYVPRALWERPKHGFGAPIGEWLRGPLNDMLHDYLAPERLRREGLFRVDFVQRLIADHEQGRKANEYYLWTLLMWETWREAVHG